jgi:RNA polymerase sigma factor (sigma-70 family)
MSRITLEDRPIKWSVVTELPTTDLLAAAAAGDQAAWNALVDRYHRLVWSVVRNYRLDHASAADVTQTVWLRLVEHCPRIREPEKLPSWLATTTRHEALRALRQLGRQSPTDFELDLRDDTQPELDDRLVEDETEREVLIAFQHLSGDCRQLLRLLSTDPPMDYDAIAAAWGRPPGSIGPTRDRCLKRLRQIIDRHPDFEKKRGER